MPGSAVEHDDVHSRPNVDTVVGLLQRGADPNAILQTDGAPTNLIGWLARCFYLLVKRQQISGPSAVELAIQNHRPDIVRILLEGGANPNIRGSHEHSVLLEAALYDDSISARLLIEHGANDVNGCITSAGPLTAVNNSSRWTIPNTPVLIWAILNEDTERKGVSGSLLRHHADPNVRDANGRSPLMWAAWVSNPESIRLLLQFGADRSTRGRDGKSAMDIAEQVALTRSDRKAEDAERILAKP
jgi:ankyrin repeat protein